MQRAIDRQLPASSNLTIGKHLHLPKQSYLSNAANMYVADRILPTTSGLEKNISLWKLRNTSVVAREQAQLS